MGNIEFGNPGYLYLFFILIPIIAWYVLKQKTSSASIQLSTIKGFDKAPVSYKYYLNHVLLGIRVLIICLLVIVLARPQSSESWENKTTKGIDIVLAIDISSSMLAQDFKPDRIEAAKTLGIEFISNRPNDRVGLVVFSGESFTQCPLTTDHTVVINLLKDLECGMIEDGTAIGLGLANAVGRLKESKAISKVVILLTDGVNNQGSIAPITAAELAKTFNIRVYTIGVGTMGNAPYPQQTPFGIRYQNVPVKIDEDVLREIAQVTDGQYFRATSNQKLREIYAEIDKLEKSKIEVKEFSKKQEEFLPYAISAGILLLIEFLVRLIILKKIP
ncbi:MAG: VWA domain-containing protein [Bacteroidales bacterium]|nr:VWA domain-containing protein [Bacteroidales bacterium]